MLRLDDQVSVAETDDGTVLLDRRAGRYWQLNSSAAGVLRTLLDRGTVDDAVTTLTERYPVSTEQASRDVNDLVDELRSAELLVGAPEPGMHHRDDVHHRDERGRQ